MIHRTDDNCSPNFRFLQSDDTVISISSENTYGCLVMALLEYFMYDSKTSLIEVEIFNSCNFDYW